MKMKFPSKSIRLGSLALGLVLFTGAGLWVKRDKNYYDKLELFNAVLTAIDQNYLEEKDPGLLIDTAINGMLADLDPHSSYLTADQFEKWNQNFEGYSGIGIYFDIIRDKITVMSVIQGGPSDKAGLLSGDRIVAIDGESAIGMKRDDVPLKLMGPRGTAVSVTVERTGWQQSRTYRLIRDDVHVESIPFAAMVRPGIGYIQIARFSSTTGDELQKAVEKLESQQMQSLLLDLRQNQGGYLESAVQVSNLFLPGGRRIVYTKGRTAGSFREFFSTNKSPSQKMIPIIVLQDRISASASEIVAGALQDWDRALIVGESSFGKGLVQTQFRFKDGSALLMTTAQYHTPSGRLIQRSYDDKSAQSYFEEILVDSLRQKWERDRSRPAFKTLILGRTLYGGGGISPDRILKAGQDTLNAVLRPLVFSPKRLIFTFVESYVKRDPELKKDLQVFLRDYIPNAGALQLFLQYIRKEGIVITDQDFYANKKDIQFLLKEQIASILWGEEARTKVELGRDQQLIEALSYLPEAESLLRTAYPLP
ncbi:S41 family peptidase [bacterium]|nr:S41 family peptidase [bacterium]